MSQKSPIGTRQEYTAKLQAGEITAEILLGEREMLLDLYKHHLKLLLEANVFIFAVTGALASFVITHTDIPHIRWVLLLPIVFCSGFAFLFVWVSQGINVTQTELDDIAGALKTNTFPLINALPIGLWVSAVALVVIVILLVAGIIWFPLPAPTINTGWGVI